MKSSGEPDTYLRDSRGRDTIQQLYRIRDRDEVTACENPKGRHFENFSK